jgi:transcriptional regulator with XRE-family HTH domain
MGCAPEPNYHGRQLIRRLKKLRELARLGQQEVADELNFTMQKLSRFENGQLPGWHELGAMLDLYGLPSSEWQPYLALWDKAKQPGWWRKFRLKDPRYVRMEHEASAKYEFQLGFIPTLLQTETYARLLLERTGRPVSSELPVRMHLQKRLYSNDKLRLHALMHESTLHHGVDRAQRIRLIERAELPNVTLQVVPQSVQLHAGVGGSVILLSFDDAEEPDIAFAETPLGPIQTQDVQKTAAARRTLDTIAATALSHDASVALIRTIATRAA